jgi:hypothetical protein
MLCSKKKSAKPEFNMRQYSRPNNHVFAGFPHTGHTPPRFSAQRYALEKRPLYLSYHLAASSPHHIVSQTRLRLYYTFDFSPKRGKGVLPKVFLCFSNMPFVFRKQRCALSANCEAKEFSRRCLFARYALVLVDIRGLAQS